VSDDGLPDCNPSGERTTDYVELLHSSALLNFVADVRTRSTVSLRATFTRLVRPAHVSHTLSEISAIEESDRRAAKARAQACQQRVDRRRVEKRAAQAAAMAREVAEARMQAPSASPVRDTALPASSELVSSGELQLPSPPPFEDPKRMQQMALMSPSQNSPPIMHMNSEARSEQQTGGASEQDSRIAADAAAVLAPSAAGSVAPPPPSSSGVLGADTSGVGSLLQSPLLSGSLPRLAPGDRLAQLELLQVAQMRVEEGRERAVFEQRHRKSAHRIWQPTVSRHLRQFPI